MKQPAEPEMTETPITTPGLMPPSLLAPAAAAAVVFVDVAVCGSEVMVGDAPDSAVEEGEEVTEGASVDVVEVEVWEDAVSAVVSLASLVVVVELVELVVVVVVVPGSVLWNVVAVRVEYVGVMCPDTDLQILYASELSWTSFEHTAYTQVMAASPNVSPVGVFVRHKHLISVRAHSFLV